eukprot:scaffold2695_cov452-Prasinococcus_capsulatus_cf.AAC.2
MDPRISLACPDWSCAAVPNGAQRNGLLKTDLPFKNVRTMRLCSASLLEPATKIPNFDEIFYKRGPSSPQCVARASC